MKDYELLSQKNQQRAKDILKEINMIEILENYGCKVNIVGSLAMGLLVKHRDIDLHVYSTGLTEEFSFRIMASLAKIPGIREMRCINGLHTDERCIAWHLIYQDNDGCQWQLDIIHIEAGTRYDGFFEKMADRIKEVLTEEQRDTILRLKYETPANEDIHGVEFYQAVIEDGVNDISEMLEWVRKNRKPEGSYWMPN